MLAVVFCVSLETLGCWVLWVMRAREEGPSRKKSFQQWLTVGVVGPAVSARVCTCTAVWVTLSFWCWGEGLRRAGGFPNQDHEWACRCFDRDTKRWSDYGSIVYCVLPLFRLSNIHIHTKTFLFMSHTRHHVSLFSQAAVNNNQSINNKAISTWSQDVTLNSFFPQQWGTSFTHRLYIESWLL